jgi:hypothetical protein
MVQSAGKLHAEKKEPAAWQGSGEVPHFPGEWMPHKEVGILSAATFLHTFATVCAM